MIDCHPPSRWDQQNSRGSTREDQWFQRAFPDSTATDDRRKILRLRGFAAAPGMKSGMYLNRYINGLPRNFYIRIA
jgi:hypothetical protein